MQDLIKALVKARGEFDAIEKNASNPFFKSKYATLSEILGAVTPALCANGLVITQPIEQTPEGAILRTQLWHESGQVLESAIAIPENKDIQKLGGSITYLRRYALSALLGITQEDDDCNTANGNGNGNGNGHKTAFKSPSTSVWDNAVPAKDLKPLVSPKPPSKLKSPSLSSNEIPDEPPF